MAPNLFKLVLNVDAAPMYLLSREVNRGSPILLLSAMSIFTYFFSDARCFLVKRAREILLVERAKISVFLYE